MSWKREYLTSIVGSILFAVAYSFIEYYTHLWDLYLPFPKFQVWVLSSYQLIYMLPVLLLVVFLPFLDDLLDIHGERRAILETFILGIANFTLLILTEDITYFLPWRCIKPRPNDPLAYKWITPDDWTCKVMGYIDVSIIIPCWYILAIIVIAILYYLVFSGILWKLEWRIRVLSGADKTYHVKIDVLPAWLIEDWKEIALIDEEKEEE